MPGSSYIEEKFAKAHDHRKSAPTVNRCQDPQTTVSFLRDGEYQLPLEKGQKAIDERNG